MDDKKEVPFPQESRDASENDVFTTKSLVRSRLKVRVFTKGDGVTIHQFRQCSNRLVRMSKSLVTHTEGLNLRVGSTNKIDLHQNCIEIAWNFA